MVPPPDTPETISPDTQAVLLLCGTFTRDESPTAKPLSPREYSRLSSWLKRQQQRPADLLQTRQDWYPAEEPGLPKAERLRTLLGRGVQLAVALERWQRLGLWVLSREEARYPLRLRRNLGVLAPPVLYGIGDVGRLDRGGLAMVGSRNVDEECLAYTRQVAEHCAAAGLQVVSGGARGVDQAAVAAALEADGGAVAVLADRVDRAATSRDAREPLRCGLLTLLTPYEPESGFTIGKAMGRNKLIYALADSALVVRFTHGEGGTWAGAMEQLDRNLRGAACVPVFVRLACNPEDGCEELCSRGAIPFPEQEFLAGNAGETLRLALLGDSEADTCYRRCLPLLLRALGREATEKQLAGVLGLVPTQLKAWLNQAIKEGKVLKKKTRGKIVYLDACLEPTLFDSEDGVA